MSNKLIYSLEDYLPLYIIENGESKLIKNGFINQIATIETNLEEKIIDTLKNEIISDTNDSEDSGCPDWVNEKIKLGAFGENIILKFLNMLGCKVKQISIENSSAGFDIEAEIFGKKAYYEVKTTTNSDLKFHITYNELSVSNKYQDIYNIFIVYVDRTVKKIDGYIINNPIKMLNINFEALTEIYETATAEIMPSSFIIKIKEKSFNGVDFFDLTKFGNFTSD